MKMKKQKGVVLFFALIVLVLMTIIGVALATNSNQSLRMAGAGADRIEAKALADGGIAEIFLQRTSASLATMSAIENEEYSGGDQVLTPLPLVDDGAGGLKVEPKNVSCQRSGAASATNLFMCRRIEVSSQVTFGRENLGRLTVVMGLEQEVFSGSGG